MTTLAWSWIWAPRFLRVCYSNMKARIAIMTHCLHVATATQSTLRPDCVGSVGDVIGFKSFLRLNVDTKNDSVTATCGRYPNTCGRDLRGYRTRIQQRRCYPKCYFGFRCDRCSCGTRRAVHVSVPHERRGSYTSIDPENRYAPDEYGIMV